MLLSQLTELEPSPQDILATPSPFFSLNLGFGRKAFSLLNESQIFGPGHRAWARARSTFEHSVSSVSSFELGRPTVSEKKIVSLIGNTETETIEFVRPFLRNFFFGCCASVRFRNPVDRNRHLEAFFVAEETTDKNCRESLTEDFEVIQIFVCLLKKAVFLCKSAKESSRVDNTVSCTQPV